MKKIVIRIILVICCVFVIAGASGTILISSLLYPKALVSVDGETKNICVGDSITYVQGVITSRKENTYTALLSEKLGDGYQVVNYGLCNRTLLSTGLMPYRNEKLYEESLNSNPDIVIIMLGTNDSKEVFWNKELFVEEYIEMVNGYKELDSKPMIYLMLPPKVFAEVETTDDCNDDTLFNEVIVAIEEVATRTGVDIIDLYSVTENHPEYYTDGLHPNKEGNKIIAEEVAKVLKSK